MLRRADALPPHPNPLPRWRGRGRIVVSCKPQSRTFRSVSATFELIKKIYCSAKMRNHNRPTHNQPNAEYFKEFLTRHTSLTTFGNVIADAVVAPQNHRRDETKHLLRFRRQRPLFICLCIQREKPSDDLIVLSKNPLIHAPPKFGELTDAIVAHAALPMIFARLPSRSALVSSSYPPM